MKRKVCHLVLWPCVVIVVAVMAWLSVSIWNLQQSREEEAYHSHVEEQTRLALWRLDSAMTGIISKENNRAAQEYFFLTNEKKGEHSPLYDEAPDFVRLYFQVTPDGELISPQYPEKEHLSKAGLASKVKSLQAPQQEEQIDYMAELKKDSLLASLLTKAVSNNLNISGSGFLSQNYYDFSNPIEESLNDISSGEERTRYDSGTLRQSSNLREAPQISHSSMNIINGADIQANIEGINDQYMGMQASQAQQVQKDLDSRMNLNRTVMEGNNKQVIQKGDPFEPEIQSKVVAGLAKKIEVIKPSSSFGKKIVPKKADASVALEDSFSIASPSVEVPVEKQRAKAASRARDKDKLYDTGSTLNQDLSKVKKEEMQGKRSSDNEIIPEDISMDSTIISGSVSGLGAIAGSVSGSIESSGDEAIKGILANKISSVAQSEQTEAGLSEAATLKYREEDRKGEVIYDNSGDGKIQTNGKLIATGKEYEGGSFQGASVLRYREDGGMTPEDREVSLSENFISISPFVPHWTKDNLFLLRTVKANSQSYVQGIWLDWAKLTEVLAREVADILPNVSFWPLTAKEGENVSARVMAALPVYVDPGFPPVPPESPAMETLKLTLGLSWGFALLAIVGVVVLLIGVVSLSERRATFVSAVTHELRTPLTTFNLYTEMLMEGLVPENKLQGYFETLRKEATRLTHMVDNVLSFSRVERRVSKRHFEQVSVQELRDQVVHCIAARLKEVDMEVQDTMAPGIADMRLETDATGVEQIFCNLADNVVKYAPFPGGVVEIHMWVDGKRLAIGFKDHGTGLPKSVMKNLFKPFSRSAEEAAGKKPGVGLGLALSREIARDLKGDLRLDRKPHTGAAYVLYLPLCNREG